MDVLRVGGMRLTWVFTVVLESLAQLLLMRADEDCVEDGVLHRGGDGGCGVGFE